MRQVAVAGIPVLALLVALCGAVLAEQGDAQKVPQAGKAADVKPGSTAWIKTGLNTVYFLKLPASYDPKAGARLIVFMHGSNMNGLQYLRTFEAMKWCDSDILLCPNGEQGDDAFGANNFTFASAKFVSPMVGEVKAAFKVTRTYIGGHSQGGFVTYSVIMHFPRQFQGAFPMAGDCWMQNEPNLWEEEPSTLADQKKIAIAVIHGRDDPVVSFSQGEHAHGVFEAMAYPMLRFFAPEGLGHQFALSPVPEALEWLDAMKGDDPAQILRLAGDWAAKGRWRDAVPAALRVLEIEKVPAKHADAARALLKKADKAAEKPVKAMETAMAKEPPGVWVPKWFEFRREFGLCAAVAPLVKKYDALRERQRSLGRSIFETAMEGFRGKDKPAGYANLEELLEKAPCSFHAWYAVKWLAEKDKDKEK